MVDRIDHIGIAVRSIAAARKFYQEVLGLVCTDETVVETQQVRIAMFAIGDTRIELLEPTSPDSPIGLFLEKRGEGVHHIAYRTDDIQGRLARARQAGCKLINETPVPGAHGREIAFLHPGSTFGVLIELCGKKQAGRRGVPSGGSEKGAGPQR